MSVTSRILSNLRTTFFSFSFFSCIVNLIAFLRLRGTVCSHDNSSIPKYEHVHVSTQTLFRSRCFQLVAKSDVRVSLDYLESHRHVLFLKKSALRGHPVLSIMSCLSAPVHHRDLSIVSRPFSFAHTIMSCFSLSVHAVLYHVFQ